MKKYILLAIIFVFFLFFSCFSTKYLRSQSYLFKPSETQDNLLIFLPGRGSDLTDFDSQGLLRIIRTSGLPVDCVSVDAELPYYLDRSLLIRLNTDVFGRPELSKYRNYWFIGNSMGSFGALLYGQKNPGKIKGIILLGPYIEEGQIVNEIAQAGGLLKWESKGTPGLDYVRDTWVYLKNCIQDASGKYPRIVFSGRKG